MAKVELPDFMQRLLDTIAQREGFKKPRYQVSKGSTVGDNYLGVVFRIEVTEADGKGADLRLIMKGMPRSAKRREEMQVVTFFKNEKAMYREVLPPLTRFLVDKGMEEMRNTDSFPFAPKCYEATSDGVEGQDTLVLEDMRPLGFTMHDRHVGQDDHQVLGVLRSLAYLHATSFAMEKQRPEEFKKISSSVTETIFNEGNPMHAHLNDIIQRTYTFIAERFPEGSDGHQRVKRVLDNYPKSMVELVKPDPKGGNCISHGDCWTNNLLFKYTKSGAVEKVCLLDFQLARYAPPILDILYLVCCCTDAAFRDKHLDRLLKEYHSILGDNLRRLGCDVDEVYPWSTLQRQLKERGPYGLGMAAMTVPLFLADAEELPDLDASFESGKEISELFSVDSKNGQERNQRLSDLVQDLMNRGWGL